MRALFYLEERIKAVRNVINNSIATTSPIIDEAVLLAQLEIYSEMKIKEKILVSINNQFSFSSFLSIGQLNMDLFIPKFVSEEEKNSEPFGRSRKWFQDSLSIVQREATVQIRPIAECPVEFLIEGRGRRNYVHSAAYPLTVIFYQLRTITDYRTSGRQKAAKSNADLPSILATYWKDVVQESGVE